MKIQTEEFQQAIQKISGENSIALQLHKEFNPECTKSRLRIFTQGLRITLTLVKALVKRVDKMVGVSFSRSGNITLL